MDSNSLINSEFIASLKTYKLDKNLTSSCEGTTAQHSASAQHVLENQSYCLLSFEAKNHPFGFLRWLLNFFLKIFVCLTGKEKKKRRIGNKKLEECRHLLVQPFPC